MVPQGYRDPTKEKLSNGRSVADIVGLRGNKGMPGVIVAPAGVDGRSTSFNPHDRNQIRISIEPDSPNGQSLTLTQFTKSAVTQAMAAAENKVPGNDIDSIRERTAVAFEELAKIANSGVQKAPAKPTVTIKPAQKVMPVEAAAVAWSPAQEQAEQQTLSALADEIAQASASPAMPPSPPLEKIDRGYSPMAAFGLKKQAGHTQRVPVVAKGAAAAPPNKLVYFEKEGIGTVPAFFHDVVIDVDRDADDEFNETGFIVLIYDLRFEQAAARWFPPADDPYKRPWAVQVSNDRRLYLVHTTGFQYVYDDREFCVLMVEKAVTAEI